MGAAELAIAGARCGLDLPDAAFEATATVHAVQQGESQAGLTRSVMENASRDIAVAALTDLRNHAVGQSLADFLGVIAQRERYWQDIDFRFGVCEIDIHKQNAGIALKIGYCDDVRDVRRFNPSRLAAEPSAMGQILNEGAFKFPARITAEKSLE